MPGAVDMVKSIPDRQVGSSDFGVAAAGAESVAILRPAGAGGAGDVR